VDVKIADMMKAKNPKMQVAFVGPPVTIEPDKVLDSTKAIDFIVRREFDHQIAAYAKGTPLSELPGVSYRKNGENVHNPEGPVIENLDELPWVTKTYKRDLDFTRYSVPFLLHPYISFYTTRGCPAMCTFCLWPQTHSGHRWRLRSAQDIAAECKYTLENFPGLKEIFFDDDTFNYRKQRTLEVCAELKKLNFTWSCTSRVTTDYETLKAMKEAGCRLMIVGYESGDEQILRNIKKGATIDMAKRYTENAHKLGLVIHGDFIVGLPGETRETLRKTIDFAKSLDVETIQVSIAHAFPGTEFYDYAKKNNLVQIDMADEQGHQLPNVVYPGILEKDELVEWVERFYGEYYFRPKQRGGSCARPSSTITSARGCTRKPNRIFRSGRSARSTSPKPRLGGWRKNAPKPMRPDARLRWKTRVFAIIVILSNAFGNLFWIGACTGAICDRRANTSRRSSRLG
jgi:radical SAM superfamily enzyme YgiQ (UPF0313 family)